MAARRFLMRVVVASVSCVTVLFGCRQESTPDGHTNAKVQRASSDQTTVAGEDTGSERLQSEKLLQQISRLRGEGRYDDALHLAEKVEALSISRFGPNHWESLDARRLVETLTTIAALPEEGLAQLARADRWVPRAKRLSQQQRIDELIPLMTKQLAVWRRWLGEENVETLFYEDWLAYCYWQWDRLPKAEGLLRHSVLVRRRVEGPEDFDTLNSMNSLAKVLHAEGKLAEAESLFRTVLQIARDRGGVDHPQTLLTTEAFASLLADQGKFPEAESLLRSLLKRDQLSIGGTNRDRLNSLNTLAVVLTYEEKFAEAEGLFRTTWNSLRRSLGPDHADTLLARSNLASVIQRQGRSLEAEPMMREILEARRRTLGEEHPDTLSSINNLGSLLRGRGEFAEAEPLLRKVLSYRRRVLGRQHPYTLMSLINLASLLRQQGRFSQAQALWYEAADSFEVNRLRVSTAGLGRVEFAKRFSPLPDLAVCLVRDGKPVEAWERLEANLARGLLDAVSARYSRPLTAEERHREETLLGQLAKTDERLPELLGKADDSRENQDRLSALRKRRELLQTRFAQFQEDLEDRYGATAGQTYSLDEIQALLSADSALLIWVDSKGYPRDVQPGGDHWACVVRQQRSPVWVKLPGSGEDGAWTKEDDDLPGRVRELLSTASSMNQVLQAKVAALYQQRLAPVESYLAGVHHLVVLPAGWMAGVPVEVLVTDGASRAGAGDYTISYAPSATMYAWLLRKRRSSGNTARSEDGARLLALGDPVFLSDKGRAAPRSLSPAHAAAQGTEAFERLPGTAREVRTIADLFSRTRTPTKATVLLGARANEREMDRLADSGQLGKYRYLHFATHAVMDDQVAMRSALILSQETLPDSVNAAPAGSQSLDGMLTAEQIIRTWRLNADLVTLSACRTGVGLEAGGEGFLGFSQALFVAGARSLVLSLWKVDDTATMLLMTRFYENLLGKFDQSPKTPNGVVVAGTAMPKAEALQEAKLWLRSLTNRQVARQMALIAGAHEGDEQAEERAVQRGLDLSKTVTGSTPGVLTPVQPFRHPYYWAAFILVGDPS